MSPKSNCLPTHRLLMNSLAPHQDPKPMLLALLFQRDDMLKTLAERVMFRFGLDGDIVASSWPVWSRMRSNRGSGLALFLGRLLSLPLPLLFWGNMFLRARHNGVRILRCERLGYRSCGRIFAMVMMPGSSASVTFRHFVGCG